jgi:hypothetical protein
MFFIFYKSSIRNSLIYVFLEISDYLQNQFLMEISLLKSDYLYTISTKTGKWSDGYFKSLASDKTAYLLTVMALLLDKKI